MTRPHENNGHDDDADPPASSSRRVWKRHGGSQGSSQLALAAMGVLYDAGEPLTRDQLAERLLPRLDAWARDYLEAWHLRRLEQKEKWRRKAGAVRDSKPAVMESRTVQSAVRDWLTEIFARRSYTTQTLIRLPDGRYTPGPKAPLMKTIDGDLVRYTPETRRELADADQQKARMHLVRLEFTRAAAALSNHSPAARAHALWFLLRRLYAIGSKAVLHERELRREFEHLLRVADTRETQEAVIRLAVEHLLAPR